MFQLPVFVFFVGCDVSGSWEDIADILLGTAPFRYAHLVVMFFVWPRLIVWPPTMNELRFVLNSLRFSTIVSVLRFSFDVMPAPKATILPFKKNQDLRASRELPVTFFML